MQPANRREFLANVGRGMLVASVGASTALDLGLAPAWADDASPRLTFGPLEGLVDLMQETPPDKLLPQLVGKLKEGTEIKTLVSAAALANARAFGGQDYVGYHTFMALVPAYQMAQELPAESRALPVLKVVMRNARRIQDAGKSQSDTLRPIAASPNIDRANGGKILQAAVRAADFDEAEALFAALIDGAPGEAFNHLQWSVQDELNVHQVVLAWRAWAMLGVAGEEHAHTLLRQSVRFCTDMEQRRIQRNLAPSEIRTVLPKLLDEHELLTRMPGNRSADDAWVEELGRIVAGANRADAAAAVASALAEGYDPEVVGEAIALAANHLVLHDPGRRPENSSREKPAGCVHGDSVGVHASDAANAWRNIARVSNPRNAVASLIVGAYHTAGQTKWITNDPYPYAAQLEKVKATDADALLKATEEAIRANDQALACACVDRFCSGSHDARGMFALLLKYAVSEDGALHAEKYYRTVSEEFAIARPTFRARQLVALARVTASEYGYPAPGYQEARELLGLG